MDDVWFEPGLTQSDVEGFTKALSLQGEGCPPLFAMALEHGGARLVAASHAFFNLFDSTSCDGLSHRLLAGDDPGAKRLATLLQILPLNGAPRLERLRFLIGPGSEVITFLCRRVAMEHGPQIFVAAALGMREGLIPSTREAQIDSGASRVVGLPAQSLSHTRLGGAQAPMSVQAIQATLRARWPTSRRVRFLWQTDENAVCTVRTPPLEEVVGHANADLVHRNLLDVATLIDPSGRFAQALTARSTWSGLNVAWPIAGAPAGVSVSLGAIPAFDREQGFEGFKGYGVIHLDEIVAREEAIFPSHASASSPNQPDNVVPLHGGRALSAADRLAFDTLGAELRDEVGSHETASRDGVAQVQPKNISPSVAPEADAATPLPSDASMVVDEHSSVGARSAETSKAASSLSPPSAMTSKAPPATIEPEQPVPVNAGQATLRLEEIGRNGLAILDRLAVGLLVSRDNVPIFANRHILDRLGFPDEDALHEAGGMVHLFGGQPGNVTGSEAVGIRDRGGAILPTHARMQCIDWDGLPATLLTLQPATADDDVRAAMGEVGTDTNRTHGATTDVQHEPGSGVQAELEELRAILETATDGVAVVDAQCNVLSLNRSAEALLGCDRGMVIGKPFLDLFPPHNQGLAADYFGGIKSSATRSLLNDGRELLIKAHQGGTIPVLMTLGRLADGDAPEGARFCALFRDLTHWKMVQGELETAKRDAEHTSALKSSFLTKVSHEIRTPLNAIIGFTEVIMEERFGPIGNERYKEYLRDIRGSGTHVMSLVNDLLDLSKIEAGRLELVVDTVDANKIVAECVGTMQPQANRERVIMRLSLAPTLPRIKADERSLRQIVLNLLSNAVKFNEPGGQVIVATTATEDGKVVIRIRDTGAGMSESDIAVAMEPFRQLSTVRRTADGTGLGLPLTKALVEANDAAFSIRSRVDQGTLVEVAFPPARVLAGS